MHLWINNSQKLVYLKTAEGVQDPSQTLHIFPYASVQRIKLKSWRDYKKAIFEFFKHEINKMDTAGILLSSTMLEGTQKASNYTGSSFRVIKAEKKEDIFFVKDEYYFDEATIIEDNKSSYSNTMIWSEKIFLIINPLDIFIVKTFVPSFGNASENVNINSWINIWLSKLRIPNFRH